MFDNNKIAAKTKNKIIFNNNLMLIHSFPYIIYTRTRTHT